MAYFKREDAAEKAVRQLKERGFETVQLDRFTGMPGEGGSDLDNPIAEPPSSLTTLTLEQVSSRDAGVLKGADPDVSGMADGNPYEPEEDLLVTVVTDESRFEEARSLLEQAGARV